MSTRQKQLHAGYISLYLLNDISLLKCLFPSLGSKTSFPSEEANLDSAKLKHKKPTCNITETGIKLCVKIGVIAIWLTKLKGDCLRDYHSLVSEVFLLKDGYKLTETWWTCI